MINRELDEKIKTEMSLPLDFALWIENRRKSSLKFRCLQPTESLAKEFYKQHFKIEEND